MKRKSLLIGVAFCLIALLVVTVYAHPGRTDSRGGHTNHSTGEYHYHHGYSAHDHYDMDGDGIVDCPYEFKDKTDHIVSEPIGSEPKEKQTEPPAAEPPEAEYEQSEIRVTPKTTFKEVVGAIIKSAFCCILISGALTYFLSYLLFAILGDDRGCSVCVFAFIFIAIIAFGFLMTAFLS